MVMRVAQITDHKKATPIQALRAVFAGIGQLLLVADRPRNTQPRAGTTEASRWRSLDETGNVRLLSAEEMAEINAERAAAAATQAAAVQPAAVLTSTPPATVAPAAPAQADAPAAAPQALSPGSPPVPGYDELTIASLRARLRNLDAAQLRVLVDYEQANAARPEILTMFERRIARLGGARD